MCYKFVRICDWLFSLFSSPFPSVPSSNSALILHLTAILSLCLSHASPPDRPPDRPPARPPARLLCLLVGFLILIMLVFFHMCLAIFQLCYHLTVFIHRSIWSFNIPTHCKSFCCCCLYSDYISRLFRQLLCWTCVVQLLLCKCSIIFSFSFAWACQPNQSKEPQSLCKNSPDKRRWYIPYMMINLNFCLFQFGATQNNSLALLHTSRTAYKHEDDNRKTATTNASFVRKTCYS